MEILSDHRRNGKAHPLPQPRQPAIVLQPETYGHIQKGVDLIADTIRPTLGPLPRRVVMEALRRTDVPEFLDDGATIARRIIQIQPRSCDVGAMLIRHALWKMRLEAGDGTTTMAVLYQALLREGIRAITQFGCNAMLLRIGLERSLPVVVQAMQQQARPLMGRPDLGSLARAVCQGDDELAELLSELVDRVGPDGLIVIEGANTLGVEREYIEGTYWKLSGWLSRLFVTEVAEKRAFFEDAALLITDFDLQEPQHLLPVLERCVQAGIKKLVILAKDISERTIGLLVNNNRAKTIQTLVVRAPKVSEMDRVASIEDIAVMTGGKPFYAAAYASFEDFRVEDLGHARRAWATDSLFGIYEGRGDPRQIRKRMAQIKGMLDKTEGEHARGDLQTRLGRLQGDTAILRIGAIHEAERAARKALAERALTSLRGALCDGVVPGGGVALLNAQSALHGLATRNQEERFAHKILARALEEPMRVIAKNAGYVPDVVLERVKASAVGFGFDAINGQVVEMRAFGVLDSASVVKKALEIAIYGAAMALTTDVIVHHQKPVECVEP